MNPDLIAVLLFCLGTGAAAAWCAWCILRAESLPPVFFCAQWGKDLSRQNRNSVKEGGR